jgi:hypothetical protein
MARGVKVGTKLRKTDMPGFTLEVLEIITSNQGPTHARTRVRLMNQDLGERLYSVSALGDPKLFASVTG